ncbi:hypothetical protein [Massilia sp. Root418]|jgi:hypothetical protein|uniref:hypothetical protein n=1 Tax=Massilia sp. Root418 TaxID=1736532 RepID=UPI000A494B7D|nr:hypothetical protein [Massilia sp. Root418]
MSNKNLANELGDKLKAAQVEKGPTDPVQDLELTDPELDDAAGGISCAVLCASYYIDET